MKLQVKDRSYKLTRDKAPLQYRIDQGQGKRPMLYWDEKKGINRPIRYSPNQKSIFVDEQDGQIVREHIWFSDGFLNVPKENTMLQQFLAIHPANGKVFVEINKEKDAAEKNKQLDLQVDALIEARNLSVEQIENMTRVLFQKDPSKTSLEELKREILVLAKNQPEDFLNLLKDPTLKMNATIQSFFDKKLLSLRNQGKEIWFNTASNKKKLTNVPYGEGPLYMAASFFESDDGIELYKHLKSLAKNA